MIRLQAIIIFVSIFLSGRECLEWCVDRNALSSVNATVHLSLLHKGKNVSENFYLLDRYTMIDVFQANVTDLCEGMIKNFPKLQVLTLIAVNMSKIQPNSFQNLPKLQQLSLAVNNLTEIPKGVFNNIPSLKILYLSANLISSIEENAFADMPNLTAVHLDGNKIVQISGNLFSGSPAINLVDWKFNLITRLSKAAFADIKPNHSKPVSIFVNKNKIEEVGRLSWEMTNSVNLHLEGNAITGFSDVFHGLPERSSLYLNNNRIACMADDVIETMRNTTKDLHVLNNPIDCTCMDRIEEILGENVYGRGQVFYNSTFPCEFAKLNFN